MYWLLFCFSHLKKISDMLKVEAFLYRKIFLKEITIMIKRYEDACVAGLSEARQNGLHKQWNIFYVKYLHEE